MKKERNKKDDIYYIISFIICIIGIIVIIIINLVDFTPKNVNRKFNLVLDKYTYASVIRKSENLLTDAVKAITDQFEFEDEEYKINKKTYQKITNSYIIKSTFSSNTINDFLDYKKIVVEDNSYYLLKEEKESNYSLVGHKIDVKDSKDNIITISVDNYYCTNSEYEGIVDKPNCEYTINKSTFDIIVENDLFKINDYKEILNIIN